MLQRGNRNRTTESTNANKHSSRSHAILQVLVRAKNKVSHGDFELESRSVKVGKLNLIGNSCRKSGFGCPKRSSIECPNTPHPKFSKRANQSSQMCLIRSHKTSGCPSAITNIPQTTRILQFVRFGRE